MAGTTEAEATRCKEILNSLYEEVTSSDQHPIAFIVAKPKNKDIQGFTRRSEITYIRNQLNGHDNATGKDGGKYAIINTGDGKETFEVVIYFGYDKT